MKTIIKTKTLITNWSISNTLDYNQNIATNGSN